MEQPQDQEYPTRLTRYVEKYASLANVATSARPVVSHIRKNFAGQLTQRKHQEILSLQERTIKEEEAIQEIIRIEGIGATAKKEEETTDPNHLGM